MVNIISYVSCFFKYFGTFFHIKDLSMPISAPLLLFLLFPPPIFFEFNCIIRAIPCLFVDFLLKSFNFGVSTYRLCGFLTACADSLVFSLPTFYDKCIHREFLKRSSQEQIPGLYSRPVIACCFDDSPFLLCSASSQTKDFPVYCPLLWPVSSL